MKLTRNTPFGFLVGLWVLTPMTEACQEAVFQTKVEAQGPGHFWSDTRTWKNGELPRPGDLVVIPDGKRILLDTSPPTLQGLHIQGQLLFTDQDLNLDAGWILISGDNALLQVGTESTPYQRRATITLHGDDGPETMAGHGNCRLGTKGLITRLGGRLQLHGASREAVSWTQLGAHANPGETTITLAVPVNWKRGDRIALAPSGFSSLEAEILTVTRVKDHIVDVEPALQYQHWGELQTYGGKTLDERAEVGLLTRNIVIRGDDQSQDAGFGGHVTIMHDSSAHLEGVEFYHMGQRGHRGRYPVSWHLVDRMGQGKHPGKGQYLRNSSIHQSFQRAVVVRGTSDVVVEDNVACDIFNHAYVPAADGDETGNIFRRNLGMRIRQPDKKDFVVPHPKRSTRSLQSERFASVFWMKNPNQVLIDNHAAGTENGNGFFFDNARGTQGIPYHHLNGVTFRGNVAHSNGDGQDPIHPGGASYQLANTRFGLFALNVGGHGRDRCEGTFLVEAFTAYKNETGGAWIEDAEEKLSNCIFADQPEGIRMVRSASLENIVFVGASRNALGNERRAPGRYGRDDGEFGESNPTTGIFFNKRNTGTTFQGSSLSFHHLAHGVHSHLAAPQGVLSDCSFERVTTPYYAHIPADEEKGKYGGDMRILDSDGSITGTRVPSLITGKEVGTLSRQHKGWKVYLTPVVDVFETN